MIKLFQVYKQPMASDKVLTVLILQDNYKKSFHLDNSNEIHKC